MAIIFQKYNVEAAQVAMNETINFAERIAPFLNPDLNLQKEVIVCLNEIRFDPRSCHVLYKFLQEYGDVELETGKMQGLTTILQELQREAPELFETVMEADNAEIIS
jgi:hypothetical protein